MPEPHRLLTAQQCLRVWLERYLDRICSHPTAPVAGTRAICMLLVCERDLRTAAVAAAVLVVSLLRQKGPFAWPNATARALTCHQASIHLYHQSRDSIKCTQMKA